MEFLEAHGVEVRAGVLEPQCRRINLPFFLRVATGRPLVVIKAAVSVDGKTATRTGDSKWITGEAARERAHLMRAQADAVLVGAGTVLADDPMLNARLAGMDIRQPLRAALDSGGRTPLDARLVKSARELATVIYTTERSPAGWRRSMEDAGVSVVVAPADGGRVSLSAALDDLVARGANEVLAEGGQALYTALLSGGHAHRLAVFVAPVLIGGSGAPSILAQPGAATIAESPRLREVEVEQLDEDVLIQGYLFDPDAFMDQITTARGPASRGGPD
jgi:diaminohydroxyphosphoribosylaminopyrimidine deaminase/5-amino-6-(5-phosphoribosylamino)uracil reductase